MKQPSIAFAVALGIVAAIVGGVLYGIGAEVFELLLGMLVVGAVLGALIGWLVAFGAFGGSEHEPARGVRLVGVGAGLLCWLIGVVLAFVISQALLPAAATSLADRLTLTGFLDYFNGLDLMRFINLGALALMLGFAWRGAR